MSILDDENILIDSARETSNNPFLTLNEYLKDFDMEGFMEVDKELVKRVLSQLNPPVLYEYKFNFEFKTDCIKLNLFNSKDRFICNVLFIKKYLHWTDKGIWLYFVLNINPNIRLFDRDDITFQNFIKRLDATYNFREGKLKFKQ